MTTLPLHSHWTLSFQDPDSQEQRQIPAQVPGNALADLVRAKLMPDPYHGSNSLLFRKFDFVDWTYETDITIPAFKEGERMELVFDGVDTIADYWLDDMPLGSSRNMFIEQRFPLTDKVRPGEKHHLTVRLTSAVNYARQFTVPAAVRTQDFNYETTYLRKARHSFGWDILPRLVGAGLWRDVRFEIHPATEWLDLYFRTSSLHTEGALCFLHWNFRTPEPRLDDFTATMTMVCGQQTFTHHFTPRFTSGMTFFFLPKPQLWFPAGHGQQPLYKTTLTLCHGGQTVAEEQLLLAVRTLKLDYAEKAQGAQQNRFNVLVNGQKIYIRGVNWTPVDALHGEHHDFMIPALQSALDMNCNMVRCWGGGVYEDHDFFDWCDRHGMLVWQDFMFACECPPHDRWYLDQVAQEAVAVIKKLRNHPSLAIWCGDNECDIAKNWLANLSPDTNVITRKILPDAVAQHDPERSYLPSSPYVSEATWRSKGDFAPVEQHPWGDRFDWKSDYYTTLQACFVSEVGYPGLAAMESLKQFLPEESLKPAVLKEPDLPWKVHSVQPFAEEHPSFAFRTPLHAKLVERSFGSLPDDMDLMVRQSQIIQAEALKCFVERFRANQQRCGGLMLWNLRDGWPQSDEAIIDWYFQRKLAFEYVRRAHEPLTMIVPEPTSWRITPLMVNNLSHDAAGDYRITDLVTGQILSQGSYSVSAGTNADLMWFENPPRPMVMLMLEWQDGDEWHGTHALLGNAPYDFELYEQAMKRFHQHYR